MIIFEIVYHVLAILAALAAPELCDLHIPLCSQTGMGGEAGNICCLLANPYMSLGLVALGTVSFFRLLVLGMTFLYELFKNRRVFEENERAFTFGFLGLLIVSSIGMLSLLVSTALRPHIRRMMLMSEAEWADPFIHNIRKLDTAYHNKNSTEVMKNQIHCCPARGVA